MSNILAAIDIGTNSTKMTVAEAVDGVPQIRFERSEVTRLGKGVDASGKLNPDAVQRTLDAVVRFAEEARSAGASTVIAAGTSALRDAANGRDLLDAVKQKAGVEVQIIAGNREAELAYAAVQLDRDLWGREEITNLLVFDIGGGSTELILGDAQAIDRYRSLDIGAVRLTERFIKSDPPSKDEIAAVENAAHEALSQFERPSVTPMVAGIGGTAVNISAVFAGRRDAPIHGSTVTRAQVVDACARFESMSLAQRREIPGLEPDRADVIAAGAVILYQLLAYVGADSFRVSTRGLRYGLLAEHIRGREKS